MRTCLISSHGGHLRELIDAVADVPLDAYFVTKRTRHTEELLASRQKYFLVDPHTSLMKYLANAVQAFRHLVRERPRVIITTGAGIAIPTVLLGRFFFRSRVVFVESAANVVTPSRTGRFLYRHADLFIIQWPDLHEIFPKAVYGGLT